MICKNCGSQMDDNMKFCEICGAPSPLPPSNKPHAASSENNPHASAQDAYYPRQSYTRPRAKTGISNTTLIIAICIIAGVLIFAGALMYVYGSEDQPGSELKGSWYNGTGTFIYYFEESDEIRFTVTGDGTGRVFDSYGEWGDWVLDIDGTLCITGEKSGYFELTYRIDGDILTLIDEDGDARTYSKTR